ncbi:protein PAF1 homolog [Momordica charantia]|uniref:Protein PAF1 homolog n=1 Tax=Momordica charantia TaxID=3673 RepID=A0A6J1DTZ1_MOMCH|nr:protein PAF1 homolog [Momordica charantia]
MGPHGYVNFQQLPTLNIPQNSEFRAANPQQLPPMINPGMYQPFMFNPVPSYHFPLSQMQIPASVHPYGMPNPSTLFPSLPPYYGMGKWVPPQNYEMISPRVPPPPQLPFLERGPQAPQLNPNILSTFNMGQLKPLEPPMMPIPTNMPMDTGVEHGGEQEKSHRQRLKPEVSIG